MKILVIQIIIILIIFNQKLKCEDNKPVFQKEKNVNINDISDKIICKNDTLLLKITKSDSINLIPINIDSISIEINDDYTELCQIMINDERVSTEFYKIKNMADINIYQLSKFKWKIGDNFIIFCLFNSKMSEVKLAIKKIFCEIKQYDHIVELDTNSINIIPYFIDNLEYPTYYLKKINLIVPNLEYIEDFLNVRINTNNIIYYDKKKDTLIVYYNIPLLKVNSIFIEIDNKSKDEVIYQRAIPLKTNYNIYTIDKFGYFSLIEMSRIYINVFDTVKYQKHYINDYKILTALIPLSKIKQNKLFRKTSLEIAMYHTFSYPMRILNEIKMRKLSTSNIGYRIHLINYKDFEHTYSIYLKQNIDLKIIKYNKINTNHYLGLQAYFDEGNGFIRTVCFNIFLQNINTSYYHKTFINIYFDFYLKTNQSLKTNLCLSIGLNCSNNNTYLMCKSQFRFPIDFYYEN